MAPSALADVAAVLGRTSRERCEHLAAVALAAESAADARASVRALLPVLQELGL